MQGLSVYVCVCVCVIETETRRERERGKDKGTCREFFSPQMSLSVLSFKFAKARIETRCRQKETI
jgi:hypothetical protein